jgi:hypothetical protein
MSQEKMVLVPQSKLDAIEEARLKLYELLKPQMNKGSVQDPAKFSYLLAVEEITQPMWLVANTKWEEAK